MVGRAQAMLYTYMLARQSSARLCLPTGGRVPLFRLMVNRYSHPMDENRDEFPQGRLSDALNGDGFPAWGPRTPLSDAVLDDALERLAEEKRLAQAQTRAAKEITAAHADPHWLDEH